MTIEKTFKAEEVIVKLDGRLESNTSSKLQEELSPIWEEGKYDILLDFEELRYVSSAGLRVLLNTHKGCKAKGKVMTIKGANASIREVFDLSGLSGVFAIV
ncbi:MAG: STAS domain-containing protein [Oscillospiraceae bacterium]|jgi:anti-sigma B factor antagonist|nr:STAS domain-containing protein [Oscillospiraceae bacterium]